MDTSYDRVLLKHYEQRPLMEIEDFIKMIYTSEFGGGHLIPDEIVSLDRLMNEYASMASGPADEPLFEDIGGDICRLNLRALKRSELKLKTVNRLFVLSAQTVKGSIDGLVEKFAHLLDLVKSGALPYDFKMAEAVIKTYQLSGYPVPSHSETYRAHYSPAYRVVSTAFSRFYPIFERIDQLLAQKKRAIVAIDGNSGSGKSTLGALVAEVYGANLFHMDDFFLPAERKTPERLAEPGGNVDYERFNHEIIRRLHETSLYYRAYDCQKGSISLPVRVNLRPVTVVEGVYSLHPMYSSIYDLSVFLRARGEEQLRRITARSGEALARRFAEEWIPLEDAYFSAHAIAEQCDLVFET